MSLPREVLKWFQCLDLTYSIRDISRDIASGFVVGEILCRHFPNEIFVHSFDNGSSRSARESNWRLIFKFCLKHSIELPDGVGLHNVLLHQNKTIICQVIVKLYSQFQRKSLCYIPVPATSGSVLPSYALPTASVRVKDSILDETVDILEQRYLRHLIIQRHEKDVHDSRLSYCVDSSVLKFVCL